MFSKSVSFLALCVGATLSAFAYSDGETIAYFPFDSDYASTVNTDKNPATFPTFGTVSLTSGGTKAAAVRSGRSVRLNTGYLETTNGRLAIDLSAFGIDESITNMTLEFFVKMTAAEVAEWARQVTFGIGGTDASGDGALGTTTVPYHLDMARQSDHIYAKLQYLEGSTVKTSYANNSDFKFYDGEWHHVAIVYALGWGGNSYKYCYLDYNKIGTSNNEWFSSAGSNWHGITPGDGQKLWLYFGTKTSGVHCRFDEFRITKGALAPSKFLHAVSDVETPTVGETLQYLPFDNSLTSIVHSEWTPSLLSGSLTYDTAVWKPRVGTKDRTELLRDSNLACVKCASSTKAVIDLPYWALQEGQLDSATIEFFIRGLGTEPDWGNAIRITDGGSGIPMLVQIPTGKFFMRMDACTLIDGATPRSEGCLSTSYYVPTEKGTPNDGKWHHVAFTISPREDGGSEIKYYFDYENIASFCPETYAWRGLRSGDVLQLANGCGVNVDEFRITKGVLPVGKFLKARGAGMFIIYL